MACDNLKNFASQSWILYQFLFWAAATLYIWDFARARNIFVFVCEVRLMKIDLLIASDVRVNKVY